MTRPEAAISVHGLGKCFRIYRDPSARILRVLTRGRFGSFQERWALRDVGFEVPRGCVLGVVGANGAGKSTLLRILGGITRPTEGSFSLRGRLGSLLSLGEGMHPDFNGKDNIFMNAAIGGIPRREVKERFHEIVEFSELGDAIWRPVRTYSSGMAMRLAFSVSIMTNPEILMLDEVLAVGDQHFQKKCMDRVAEIRRAGTTILFVSHSTYHVRQLCDEAIWLEQGRVTGRGDPARVTDEYISFQIAQDRRAHPEPAARPPREPDAPSLGAVSITRTESPGSGGPFTTGESVDIQIAYRNPPRRPCHVAIAVTRNDGVTVFSASTRSTGEPVTDAEGSSLLRLALRVTSGEFALSAWLLDEAGEVLDERRACVEFKVTHAGIERGVFLADSRWLTPEEARSSS
jgi:lipopolysaccharide transport system ATP-binding protein